MNTMIYSQLHDVFRHMEWSDSRIWATVLESEKARSDRYILETLHHIHETQHAFLSAWLHGTFRRWKLDSFETATDLAAWGLGFHSAVRAYTEGLTEASIENVIVLPWAHYFTPELGQEPGPTTIGETLHQLPSHSMHHRGQVARRLRELDVPPPMLDYIFWVMGGRPQPVSLTAG